MELNTNLEREICVLYCADMPFHMPTLGMSPVKLILVHTPPFDLQAEEFLD